MLNAQNVYGHLYAVPKGELVKSLRSIIGDEEVVRMLAAIQGHPATVTELRKASYENLVTIAETADNFTTNDALSLYEEFRYKGTKSIFIYIYSDEAQRDVADVLQSNDLARLDGIVQGATELRQKLTAYRYSDLRLRETDWFTVDGEKCWELAYSYVAEVKTTDPETEEIMYHQDLRYGFIWVNQTTPWIAISARDRSIANFFAEALGRFLNCEVLRLLIPKEAEIAVEGYENVRRATHVDTRGVRTRVLHRNLYSLEDEVRELQLRDQEQARWSSGYNADLDDARFVLSYSRERGAISLSKFLRTSQLRVFGVGKIRTLYDAIRDLRSRSPEIAVPLSVEVVLAGSQRRAKEAVSDVLTQLAVARSTSTSLFPVNVSPFELARLKQYFTWYAEAECAQCGELEYIQCGGCGSERFAIDGEQLICRGCGSLIVVHGVQCPSGHEIQLDSVNEAISLYPTTSLLRVAEQVIAHVGLTRFNRYEEGFFVHGTSLYTFGSHGEKTVYLWNEIPEFSVVAGITLSAEQSNRLDVVLSEFKEKCSKMAIDSCSMCVDAQVGRHCLMRLFGLYDKRYTPRPHRGGEFGDVSLNVTLDGRPDQIMTVLLKSRSSRGRTITLRHPTGQDLFSQVDEFWTDPRVALIATGVPQPIEDGFTARLQREAQRHGKKLIFLGTEELSRMIQFVSDRDGVHPREL